MLTKDIENNFPFLSVVNYGGKEYIGVVINQDASVTSMYVYTGLHSKEEQERFLELGDVWWWESNRMIPINLFLKKDFAQFGNILITFNIRDTEVVRGPSVSIADLAKKRSKRRNIQLIKKVK